MKTKTGMEKTRIKRGNITCSFQFLQTQKTGCMPKRSIFILFCFPRAQIDKVAVEIEKNCALETFSVCLLFSSCFAAYFPSISFSPSLFRSFSAPNYLARARSHTHIHAFSLSRSHTHSIDLWTFCLNVTGFFFSTRNAVCNKDNALVLRLLLWLLLVVAKWSRMKSREKKKIT